MPFLFPFPFRSPNFSQSPISPKTPKSPSNANPHTPQTPTHNYTSPPPSIYVLSKSLTLIPLGLCVSPDGPTEGTSPLPSLSLSLCSPILQSPFNIISATVAVSSSAIGPSAGLVSAELAALPSHAGAVDPLRGEAVIAKAAAGPGGVLVVAAAARGAAA
ncbi:hypothetical protein V494_02181, partial [Pseudogymnoascus sp. VKM F-4513 (FW-928)]